jgi:cyclase
VALPVTMSPGADKVTVAIDVAKSPSMPSGYEVWIDGGRTATGTGAVGWARRVDGYGVRTILPMSKSTGGVRTGYELPLIEQIKAAPAATVVASGGAGTLEHVYDAVQAGATVLLATSVFRFGIIEIPRLKEYLRGRGVPLA